MNIQERHKMLHSHLDELFSCFITENPQIARITEVKIDELLNWSYRMTQAPYCETRHNDKAIQEHSIDRVRMEKVRIVAGMMYDKGEVQVSEDVIHMALRTHLETYMLGIKDEVVKDEARWPCNAWQMWKRDHAPEWFKRRYPVQYEGQILSVQAYKAVCPHLTAPNDGPHVEFMHRESLPPLAAFEPSKLDMEG